jgi:GGDEF domain-containing protein
MISLTASMRLDEARALLEEVSGAYCGALASAQDAVVDVEGLQAWDHREEFGSVAAKGRETVERLRTADLAGVERALRAAFRRQVEKIRELVSTMAAENESILTALQEALSSLSSSGSGEVVQATKEIGNIRKIAELDDLARIRSAIRETTDRLEACMAAIQREKDTVIIMLRDEIRTLQRSVDQMRTGSSGVLSRSQFEACAARTISSGVFFCVIHVSIRNRSQIERLRGPGFAENAIRSLSSGLQEVLPPGSLVGHWSETEFCAIVLVPYHDAIQKTRDIAALLERSEAKAGSTQLKAQLLTVPFNPEEGTDKLTKRLQKLMAG